MKLKTKFQDEDFELGEVVDVAMATMPDGMVTLRANADKGGLHTFYYKSLKELYDNWEDVPEESKGYWYLDNVGDALQEDYDGGWIDERRKQIGNYFETKEECRVAVEKLKAITRLQNKGFKFNGWEESVYEDSNIIYFTIPKNSGIKASDLDLLFSGDGEE